LLFYLLQNYWEFVSSYCIMKRDLTPMIFLAKLIRTNLGCEPCENNRVSFFEKSMEQRDFIRLDV
jgi:hypothetical protein